MAVNPVPVFVASTEAEATADLARLALSSLLDPAGGVVEAGGLEVKAKATANMEVEVEGGVPEGEIWIPGTSLSTQGMYFCLNESKTALAIGAASTSNPRVDTIIAQVKDSFYAGSENKFLLNVIAGTPKAGISHPPTTRAEAEADGAAALPASSYALAYILVPQNAFSITSGDIENVAQRVRLSGSVLLAPESVTDADIVKGRALINTTTNYPSESTHATKAQAEAGIEISPSKMSFVIPSNIEITVNGQAVSKNGSGFLLPPGQKFHAVGELLYAALIL